MYTKVNTKIKSVRASTSIHDYKELRIVIKPIGKIATAFCYSMAEASRCFNHIIATLYQV